MTAPISTTPAPTSASAIEDAIGSAWRDTMVEQGTAETALVRDPATGRFVPRDAEAIAAAESGKTSEQKADKRSKGPEATGETGNEDGDATTTPETGPTTSTPTGDTVVFEAADPATLITTFTLKDATGELAIPKGLMVEYQANGKTRNDPLDKVVKLAQMGVYNAEREQRVQQAETKVYDVEHQLAQVDGTLREREAQIERLLADPAFRERAVQAYQEQQTPEMQAQRLREEREQFQIEKERSEVAQVGEQYYEKEIVPAIAVLEQTLPHVTTDEITVRLAPFVNRLRDARTGLVPPQRFAAISQHFLSEIVPWAQQLDELRATERGTKSGRQQAADASAAQQQTQAELDRERVRAQKARRLATTHLKPPGRSAAPVVPAKKAPSTHAEIMEDVIASALAGTQTS